MPATRDPKPSWRRLTSLGFEFFGAVLGFVLLGIWIDRNYDTRPWGILICAGLGIVGGLYNLIRSALNAFPTSDTSKSGKHGE